MSKTQTDGERLNDYLELYMVNKSQLCRKMDIGRSTLHRLIADGIVVPGYKKKIADVLGVKITDIWPAGIPIEDPKDVGIDKVAALERDLDEAHRRIDTLNNKIEDLDKRVRSLEAESLKRGGGKGLKFRS